jgi:hypothetical protein
LTKKLTKYLKGVKYLRICRNTGFLGVIEFIKIRIGVDIMKLSKETQKAKKEYYQKWRDEKGNIQVSQNKYWGNKSMKMISKGRF